MRNYIKSSIYGIEIYSFKTENNMHYQLTFDKDTDFVPERVNVHLQNFFFDEEAFIDYDINRTVCECFIDYFENFPDHNVFYEIEITHKRNLVKFFKFIRWAKAHKNFSCKVEITEIGDKTYAEVYIKKKPLN